MRRRFFAMPSIFVCSLPDRVPLALADVPALTKAVSTIAVRSKKPDNIQSAAANRQ
jgi:hypothetical protein